MRLLLDECLPRLVEPAFDVFVMIDGNTRYQQNLSAFRLAFVMLTAVNNKLETFQPLMPQV